MATWWLSFLDPDQPVGQQFVGVSLIEAGSLEEAITISWARGCNPGGEIQALELEDEDSIPPDKMAALMLAPRDRLLDMAAIQAYGLGD